MRCTKKQISKALATAQRLLERNAHPAEAAVVLNPYMDCTEVEGASGQEHDDIRSAIFAAMGDAYRREGTVELAARWYRRASAISPGNHATVYAHLVCKHQLADFYDDALKTVQEHRQRSRAKPLIVRLLLWVWRCADGDARQRARRAKHDLEFLRSRVPQMQEGVAKAA